MRIFENRDCMDGMKEYPDKFFELAIVDPPYGIGINMNQGRRSGDIKKHAAKDWDAPPGQGYWDELFRCSERLIVWGANNFPLASNGWIVWDKDITGDVDFSRCELAYTNFLGHIERFESRAQSGNETYSNKIHPTQKPVALYKWLLKNYAHEGDKILDTHVGSASSLIACEEMGFDYVGFELDKDYYEAAQKRLTEYRRQLKLDLTELQ